MNQILFIEDDPGAQETVKRLYQMCDISFHRRVKFDCVKSWEAAEEFMETTVVDVVLADLSLSDNCTADVSLTEIQERAPRWPPIIVITGNVVREEELRVASIKAGAVDFITKSRVVKVPECTCERVYIAHLRRVFHAHA